MALSDKQQQQTSEAKNAVEAYVYSKLSDSLAEYATEEDKASISKKLTETEVSSQAGSPLLP